MRKARTTWVPLSLMLVYIFIVEFCLAHLSLFTWCLSVGLELAVVLLWHELQLACFYRPVYAKN